MKSVKYRLVFNRRNKKLEQNEKSLVQIEAYLNPQRKYISTGIYLTKDQWNAKEQKVQKHDRQLDLNIALRNKLTDLLNYEYSITNKGGKFSLSMFDIYLEGRDTKNFVDFMNYELNIREDIAKITKKQHQTLINRIKKHGKIKLFSDLTFQNISDFDNWLYKQGLMQSTIGTQHKIIKIYIHKAIRSGLMDMADNPYLKFKAKRATNTERRYLTAEELSEIEKKDFGDLTRVAIMRDLFVFSCYTGLAYADASKLTEENLIKENGELWIKVRRKKTDQEMDIMLLPKALEIINKYKGVKRGKLLPYISNQRMNGYLKLIADACGIKKQLTTHSARHTFATTVTLMNGVSLEVVQKMLGHSSIRTTEIYAKIVNKRIMEEMSKLRDKIS